MKKHLKYSEKEQVNKSIPLLVFSDGETFADGTGFLEEARALADHLKVPFTADVQAVSEAKLFLRFSREGLSLEDGDLVLLGDFTQMLPRLMQGRLGGELLVKASKIKGNRNSDPEGAPVIVDATAGMGEDSLLLAAAGFRVIMVEYDPVIAALLRDTLRRASHHPELGPVVARMEVIEGNSLEILPSLPLQPDVVFLDPMFPERQKTGLIKKKFQLLQQLEKPCCDEEELLRAAMEAGPVKIVIKRPLKGPFLAGVKPDFSNPGKAIRYDCILPQNKRV